MRIVKLGGSLLKHAKAILPLFEGYEVLIIPGGGVFADTVRKVSQEEDIPDEAAHEMAMLAIHQYGFLLSSLSGIPLITTLKEFKGQAILEPGHMVRSSDLQATWDVTSDSIACYAAHLAGETEFIKLTDVEGIIIDNRLVSKIEAGKLLNTTTCLDKSLPRYLQSWKMNCRVVNGRHREDIIKALKGESAGTLVIGGH